MSDKLWDMYTGEGARILTPTERAELRENEMSPTDCMIYLDQSHENLEAANAKLREQAKWLRNHVRTMDRVLKEMGDG